MNTNVCDYCGDPGATWKEHQNASRVYCSDFHAAMGEARDLERSRTERILERMEHLNTVNGTGSEFDRGYGAAVYAARAALRSGEDI